MTTRRAFLESLGLALGVGVVAKAALRPEREIVDLTQTITSFTGPGPLSITHIDYETRTVTVGPSFYARDPFRLATPSPREVEQYGFRKIERAIATTSQRVRP